MTNNQLYTKTQLQRKLCKKLLTQGKKEEAKNLWSTIKEIEKRIDFKSIFIQKIQKA